MKEVYAELFYVTAPDEKQIGRIKDFLAKEFHSENITLELKEDASLKSGFILRTDTREYDWSEKGRIEQLKNVITHVVSDNSDSRFSEEGIISILRSNIEEFELEAADKEVGVVKWVGDGIANIDGIDHACYGEIVLFDCGIKGMVQDIRRDEIGVILFGRDTEVHEGSRVVRTGKMAGISVGDAFLGRVVDALG
ncbi:MAG: F0F1 ATP synthase subunit delta [Lachnospiraceae bacterium]|nr:F0F1 ATP synthase subunit delta [Lachnospiraceae bacterium]